MAEIATEALRTLLPRLGDLLKEEYMLQKSTQDEIMSLKAELESMHTALLKVAMAPIDQPPDIQVKLWARDVRDMSYKIEDNIDKFMVRIDTTVPTEPHRRRVLIDWGRSLVTKTIIRHNIGTEVKEIKSHIKEISERRDRYKVDNVVAEHVGPSIASRRLSALYKKVTELVGIEEKSDGLINRLMEGDEASRQQLKIVSIVGFGGLGKTTLANVVYQELKVQFDCGAFVSVSLNPNMEKIFKNMLHQLDKHKYKSINEAMWDEAQLTSELREFLQDKRYFIVIDDLWNNSVWDTIKYALVENECGSRIITTTRILGVANHVGGAYQLKPLSPVDSRKLFYQRIFGVEDQLVEVSKKILKKCGGVPLAIITIASLLASKKDKEDKLTYWSKVCQSIGSGLKGNLHIDNMRRILSISYYDLPPHLKTCLLYLSLYPEDYEIYREDLIWKWVGEGFVHNEQGKSLNEVGEDYLDELINRCLIQPGRIYGFNVAMSCRVHDMVLDLITSLSNEEHFLTALGRQQPVSVPRKIHRLSLQTSNEDDDTQLSNMSLSHVRSLTVFDAAFSSLPALSSFQVLRALDLRNCEQVNNHHCKDICNLFHLRYLKLCGTSVSKIPKEIRNLQFLQVLHIKRSPNDMDLPSTFIHQGQLVHVRGIELPSTFVQLGQLVQLHVDSSTRLPDGFGNLKCLQELRGLGIWSPNMLHDLGRLTELRNLKIFFHEWDAGFLESFLQGLSNLASLEILEMDSDFEATDLGSEDSLPVPGGLQQLCDFDMCQITLIQVPSWMSSLSSLSSLHISLETLEEADLGVLGTIPSLVNLDLFLKDRQGRDERLVIDSDYPFPCLTRLRLESAAMEVVFAQGAMQNLQTLELKFECETIDLFWDFDLGLGNLSSLGHVSVYIVVFEDYDEFEEDAEAAEAAIRESLEMNPNNPTLEFKVEHW